MTPKFTIQNIGYGLGIFMVIVFFEIDIYSTSTRSSIYVQNSAIIFFLKESETFLQKLTMRFKDIINSIKRQLFINNNCSSIHPSPRVSHSSLTFALHKSELSKFPVCITKQLFVKEYIDMAWPSLNLTTLNPWLMRYNTFSVNNNFFKS